MTGNAFIAKYDGSNLVSAWTIASLVHCFQRIVKTRTPKPSIGNFKIGIRNSVTKLVAVFFAEVNLPRQLLVGFLS